MSGLKTAVSYSLPSFSLGFCGPKDSLSRKILFDFAVGKKVSEVQVRRRLSSFEALYPYLKLIARKNKIQDPFDLSVIKAYWIGNELLEEISGKDLKNFILTEFSKKSLLGEKEAKRRAERVSDDATAHHTFHVLVLGAVTGRVRLEGKMFDLCRTGWGKVKKVNKDNLQVEYKPLVLGKKIKLGKMVKKRIFYDKKIVPGVKIGDWVSFHWANTCEILTLEEVKSLEYYTQRTLDLINIVRG